MPDSSPRPPWRVTLPHSAAAVPMARAVVRNALGTRTEGDALDTAELLTAELVANAVEHTAGDEPIRLIIVLLPAGSCRVEVHDRDPEPPRALTRPGPTVMPEPWQEDGRGLLLIRTLSAACGHRQTDEGKAVWFTLAEHAGADPAQAQRSAAPAAPGMPSPAQPPAVECASRCS